MTAYIKNLETEIFSLANEQYGNMITNLLSSEMHDKEHGQIEAFINTQGKELMRCLLQSYLNLRSQGEIKQTSISGSDGVERTHRRKDCSRTLATIFGDVELRRISYSKPGVSTLFPLDCALNLPPDKYSQGLREIVAESAAKGSFENVVRDIAQYTAGKVPKRQAEQLVQKVSEDFDEFYEQKPCAEVNSEDLLILTTDAKGIVVRQEDLREATRKAAENERHKKQTRLSRGEKNNRKRMAQVASIYSINPHKRTAEDIMNIAEIAEVNTKRPKPANKRVWASIEKNSNTVIQEMFEEANRRDPEKQQQWIALVDGNTDQIKRIEAAALAMNVCLVIVMDFIHVLEYLWKSAYALFGEDGDQAEKWVSSSALKLLYSKTRQVVTDMRSRATRAGLTSDQRKPVEVCATYLLKNKKRLDYKMALENGWPIATGVIEGACRHLIKDRMDITGARWSLTGAEGVLKLRALRSSGDMDAYKDFHVQQERKRNYRELNDYEFRAAA